MARKVTVTFSLDEEVTPELFGEKIARALTVQGTLRVGESFIVPQASTVFTIVEHGEIQLSFEKQALNGR